MRIIKVYWVIILAAIMSTSSCLLDDETQDLPTLLTLLEKNAQFSIFLEGCDRINIYEQLDGGLNLTLFAPTNNAFEEFLSENNYASINDVPVSILDQLISYHIQLGIASLTTIRPAYYVTPTTNGADSTALSILIDQINGELVFNNIGRVVVSDIQGKNGYLHGLNKVLPLPAILDLFTEERNSIFIEALEKTDMLSILEDGDAYTVFVPTDQAFEEYFAANDGIESLDDWQPERLKQIVRYHILEGNQRAESFQTVVVETLESGQNLDVTNFNNALLINQRIGSLAENIQGTNGVVHFIGGILLPD